MTRKQAIAKLRETRQLSTGMLKPLGISFESFLRFAQLPAERADALIDKVLEHFEGAQ